MVVSVSSSRHEIDLATVHSFLWPIPYANVPFSAGSDNGIFVKTHPAHGVVFINNLRLSGIEASAKGLEPEERPSVPLLGVVLQSLSLTRPDVLLGLPHRLN